MKSTIKKVTRGLILAVIAVLSGTNISFAAAAVQTSDPVVQLVTPRPQTVIINEIKLSGANTTPIEYVTVFNAGDSPVSLAGWSLEYAKPAFTGTACALLNWKSAASSSVNTVNPATLSGITVPAGGLSAPIPLAMNDDAGGAVHLLDDSGSLQDIVGWGSAGSAAPCFQTAQAAIPPKGSSLQRYLDCTGSGLMDRSDNSADFAVGSALGLGQLIGQKALSCPIAAPAIPTPVTPPVPAPVTPAPPTVPNTPTPPAVPVITVTDPVATTTNPGASPVTTTPVTNTLSCEGIELSELLPNPASIDTGHEFIELHNPTDEVIALNGCSLQVSATTSITGAKSFALPALSLEPGDYHAFYDNDSGLTLPNASGGTVWLVTAANDESPVTYPGNMADGVSWIFDGGVWTATYSVTPNSANVLTATEPCPAGQVRNSDTNRCNAIITTDSSPAGTASTGTSTSGVTTATTAASTSSLAPCKVNQTRNPETNRCRNNTGTTAGTAASCPTGQERNPDTNRCKAIATTASATATACKAGQERNPETNRCRNITTAAGTAKACPAGQERNTETNRCRKVTAGANTGGSGNSLDNVKDVASGTSMSNSYWILAALALTAAIGYAMYEWRQEVAEFIEKRFGIKLSDKFAWLTKFSRSNDSLHPTPVSR